MHMTIRTLSDVWPRQAALNRRAGFDTDALGRELTEAIAGKDASRRAASSLSVGKAVKNYLDALLAECLELQECLSWKHWYREAKDGRQYALRDLQNARVEVVDMLFFWVSLCQLLGLTPEDVFRLYEKKLEINIKRQDENRTQAEHADHEDENRSVK